LWDLEFQVDGCFCFAEFLVSLGSSKMGSFGYPTSTYLVIQNVDPVTEAAKEVIDGFGCYAAISE
jgi:hypothetical protein